MCRSRWRHKLWPPIVRPVKVSMLLGSQQPVDQLMIRTKESEANEIGVRLKIRLELGWHLFKVGGGACEHFRDTSFDRLRCQAASRLKG